MVELKRILVPVDFSDCSSEAVEYAAMLATQFGATIDLLHVWEVPPYIPPEAMVGVPGHDTQSLATMAHSHAEKEMAEFIAKFADKKLALGEAKLESGDPARTVIDVLEGGGYDMIVMGTHGRTGLAHLLMGSVAEKVVRRASCPVLTVRASQSVK